MNAKLSIVVIAIASICAASGGASAQQSGTAEVERYIRDSERQWAETVFTGDVSVIERILADDFLGIDPDGNFFDKAKMVADTREAPKEFISNRITEMKVRFFGDDTAVAQGDETWERRTGIPRRARFVWTDTWILRNGKWQIVASEDLIAPEPAQQPAK
ncbi:MAG: nuclear transport factor 2 family protein [Hyphomicrobium sp.]|uniref:nuclear transport factor 2 family protein n=1 Tax=Hyphomicrobium sp. TaxID=82 RepID=UPI003D0AD0F3